MATVSVLSAFSLSVILLISILHLQLVSSSIAVMEGLQFSPSAMRAQDTNGIGLGNSISHGQEVILTFDASNNGNSAQPYVALLQISTKDGETVYITSQIGTAASVGNSINPRFAWQAGEAGAYIVRAFLWTSLINPTPLSDPSEMSLTVSSNGNGTTNLTTTTIILRIGEANPTDTFKLTEVAPDSVTGLQYYYYPAGGGPGATVRLMTVGQQVINGCNVTLKLVSINYPNKQATFEQMVDADPNKMCNLVPCTTYIASTNTIRVQCNTDFEVVAMENPTRIVNEGNGTFIINSIVQVDSGKTLTVQTPTRYLKITEDNGLLGAGSLFIDGVKITSWDITTNDVVQQNVAGSVVRGWVTGDPGLGVLDIRNAEIGYLGYAAYDKQGITFYNDHGRMFNNTVTNNYYGVFSYEVSDLIAENNTLDNNILYGFDPHTYTKDSSFRNNVITNTLNGIGLICSDNCSNITFENNRLMNNKVGIMFSMHMDNSLVRNNTIIGSFDVAMSVSDSANNMIEYNHIFDSRYGIAMKVSGTHNNEVRFNDLHNIPRDGIQISAETSYNSVHDNLLQNVTNSIVNRSTTTTLYNNTLIS